MAPLRRKRDFIIPALGFTGYYLHKLDRTREIRPHRKDWNQDPFLINFVVKRKLKDGRWAKELKLTPHRSGKGKRQRWDLSMCIKSQKTVYLHRLVALSHRQEGGLSRTSLCNDPEHAQI